MARSELETLQERIDRLSSREHSGPQGLLADTDAQSGPQGTLSERNFKAGDLAMRHRDAFNSAPPPEVEARQPILDPPPAGDIPMVVPFSEDFLQDQIDEIIVPDDDTDIALPSMHVHVNDLPEPTTLYRVLAVREYDSGGDLVAIGSETGGAGTMKRWTEDWVRVRA